MRRDADALQDLRKKLSVLWGNLEQTKAGGGQVAAAAPEKQQQQQQAAAKRQRRARNKQQRADHSARFFSAAVEEFGVERADGTMQRLWKLFGTTIQA